MDLIDTTEYYDKEKEGEDITENGKYSNNFLHFLISLFKIIL